eukprot:12750245-Ditylum_brightwellii.AAC.1
MELGIKDDLPLSSDDGMELGIKDGLPVCSDDGIELTLSPLLDFLVMTDEIFPDFSPPEFDFDDFKLNSASLKGELGSDDGTKSGIKGAMELGSNDCTE